MNTKISALFLMMLMALGVTGIGAAYWNHSLQVTGTFTTGTFGVDWSLHCWGHTGWKEDEEIATFDASIDNTVDPKTLTMTLTNGFPCLWWWIVFDLHCMGSVPAHIENFAISGGITEDAKPRVPIESFKDIPPWLYFEIHVLWPEDELTTHPEEITDPEDWDDFFYETPDKWYYYEGPEGLATLLNDLEGKQLHYCDVIWFVVIFHLYEYEPLNIEPPQDTALDFTIDFDAVQFNTP